MNAAIKDLAKNLLCFGYYLIIADYHTKNAPFQRTGAFFYIFVLMRLSVLRAFLILQINPHKGHKGNSHQSCQKHCNTQTF